jgi:Glycosyltransferase family 87
MTGRRPPAHATQVSAGRWLVRTAAASVSASILLMVALGIAGPPAGKATLSPAPPWPPWSAHVRPSPALWSVTLWLIELLGGVGLILALVAVRRGWRPRPSRLVLGSAVAVIALMVVPPVDNGDPVMYAAFGRIAVLGHSPYVMTPGQLKSAGDPVGAAVGAQYWKLPSRYGPAATLSEAAASEIAGDSAARTTFWLKVWNGLAYLALVLALDRLLRADAGRRTRAHLLWSVNPLMLFAVMASGHNDVLAAAAGASALFVLRRVDSRRALLAGVLLGLATAVKAPYALFGAGLVWAARRSPHAITALAAGAATILLLGYLLAGWAAISATAHLASVQPDLLWLDLVKALNWQQSITRVNILAMMGSAVLAVVLLWRMPEGPRGLPAVRVALALALGLLMISSYQTAWYDVMIFPLLAVMPPSRLDWLEVVRATALTMASAPFFTGLDPSWLIAIQRVSTAGSPLLILVAVDVALLWCCLTRAWGLATDWGPQPVGTDSAPLGDAMSPTH